MNWAPGRASAWVGSPSVAIGRRIVTSHRGGVDMISGDTPAFTITQFLISLVAIVGAIVATGGVLYSTLHDDIKQVRTSIERMQIQLGGLRSDLTAFSGRTENVASKLDGMTSSINELTNRMDQTQTHWDPKVLAEVLKKEGFKEQNIVIISPR
jgi:methyl-accepting chemotaxis protein